MCVQKALPVKCSDLLLKQAWGNLERKSEQAGATDGLDIDDFSCGSQAIQIFNLLTNNVSQMIEVRGWHGASWTWKIHAIPKILQCTFESRNFPDSSYPQSVPSTHSNTPPNHSGITKLTAGSKARNFTIPS